MTQSERVHFKIALPTDLKQRLEHEAVDNRRSLSAEIIARLEASFQQQPALSKSDIKAIVDVLKDDLKKSGGLFGLLPKDGE